MPTRPFDGSQRWDWKRAYATCMREARRYGLSPADAEDVAQESLARGWRYRASCRDAAAQQAWFAQIARREALRHLRSTRRTFELRDAPEQVAHDTADESVDRIDLQRSLGALSAEERLLIQMRYERDLTESRTAELLGMPEGTVKVRLHRLRARLRAELAGQI